MAAARAVQTALSLDRLLLVVANDPWQKSPTRRVSAAEDRFALTEALADGIPGVEASRLEIDRGGPSYSVVTAEEIRRQAGRPEPELFLVVGADLVPELESWERSKDLRRLVTLAVVSRPTSASHPTPVVPSGWRVEWIDGPMVDVSSSEVRQALSRGGPIEHLVPPGVVHCIRGRNMYAVLR